MKQDVCLQKNQIVELTITDITAEGNGVGRHQGMAVFVPETAVGDVITAKIVKVCKSYAYGIVEAIVSGSADRVEPDCPVFKQCGGCLFRHLTYAAECRIKAQWVSDAFVRLGGLHPTELPIVAAEAPDGYRNKAQLPCAAAPNGEGLCFGFYAKRSHRLIPHTNCLLQAPQFAPIMQRCAELLATYPPYCEADGSGIVRHLYLRRGFHSGAVMVCFVVAKPAERSLTILAKQLCSEFSEIASVMMNVNPKRTNVILGAQTVCLWGQATIPDVFCGIPVALSPQSFYQVNTVQAERLFAEVRRLVAPSPEMLLLDLYCGTGVIGLSMADAVRQVIGVEVVEQAVVDARENAMRAGITNATFSVGDAGTIAAEFAKTGVQPHCITLDPPRKGCDAATLQACVDMAPARIVMVSCNPATAARDAKFLCENGYELQTVRPVDLFPRTGHVETVVLMSRKEK